ncbi:GGDEF domain-containing protein [Enterobacter cloacae]|uniref:GGDEF domain-containing protein n=1 Tax=Enterobacter cloacae TaxID=550 RepID=UPI002032AF1D|nr:GGDEF domain-containing protein [Enterobacter cloacae]
MHANFDALTGLPNRRLLVNRLELALTQARADRREVALLFIDLDRFKPVNDMYGHAVGDELLRLVAHRLQSVLREGDTVARLGGDEYIVLLPGLEANDTLTKETADKINSVLSQSFMINDHVITVSGSIGAAIYPHDATNVETLLNTADKAMYITKKIIPRK